MADKNESPKKVNYGSNSHKSKESTPDIPEKRTEQVVTGTIVVRKKPLGKKFLETFVQEDGSSLKEYLIFDVVVPATKNLLLDLLQQGSQRLFYGSSRPSSNRNYTAGGGTQVRYNSMYGSQNQGSPRTVSRQNRANHDFSEIVLASRAEAETVLDRLSDLIDQYGIASVSDFYDCVGVTGNFTDNKYGWTNLAQAQVRQIRGGYLIVFPNAEVIE